MQLPAPVGDHATDQFVNRLLAQHVLPPRGVALPRYANDQRVVVVSTQGSVYPNNECWFNVVDYCFHQGAGARPVFGWAVWLTSQDPNEYVAQHHAVAEVQGVLLDVTLNAAFKEITFLPDSRTPFDFDKLRYPFSFQSGRSGDVWYAGERALQNFAIARMDPTTEDLVRIQAIIARGRSTGVI
jgi:hypothetical protein